MIAYPNSAPGVRNNRIEPLLCRCHAGLRTRYIVIKVAPFAGRATGQCHQNLFRTRYCIHQFQANTGSMPCIGKIIYELKDFSVPCIFTSHLKKVFWFKIAAGRNLSRRYTQVFRGVKFRLQQRYGAKRFFERACGIIRTRSGRCIFIGIGSSYSRQSRYGWYRAASFGGRESR